MHLLGAKFLRVMFGQRLLDLFIKGAGLAAQGLAKTLNLFHLRVAELVSDWMLRWLLLLWLFLRHFRGQSKLGLR
jgi:hypothetical protein